MLNFDETISTVYLDKSSGVTVSTQVIGAVYFATKAYHSVPYQFFFY